MKCSKFPDREASGMCSYSGKPYCAEELVEVQGKVYAKDNLGLVMAEMKDKFSGSATPNPMVFMNGGGAAAASSSATAPPIIAQAAAATVDTKSRGMAALLAFFLGTIGAHKFYVGSIFWGLVYLVFCWTGIPTLLGIIEGLNYMFMSDATFYRRYG